MEGLVNKKEIIKKKKVKSQEKPTISVKFEPEYHPDNVSFTQFIGKRTTWKSLYTDIFYVWYAWKARRVNAKILKYMPKL